MNLPRSTTVMLGLLLVCAGVLGGIQIQKTWGSSSTRSANDLAAAFQQQRAQRGNGAFPGATGAPGAGQGAPTTGTIKLVDGKTVYIETADGRTITITTSDTTKVTTATATDLKNLKAGQTVSVTGTSSDSTTMTATSITATP